MSEFLALVNFSDWQNLPRLSAGNLWVQFALIQFLILRWSFFPLRKQSLR